MDTDKQYYLDMFIANYNMIKEALGADYLSERVYNKHRPKGSMPANRREEIVNGSNLYSRFIDLSMVKQTKPIKINVSVDLVDVRQLIELNDVLHEITNRIESKKREDHF